MRRILFFIFGVGFIVLVVVSLFHNHSNTLDNSLAILEETLIKSGPEAAIEEAQRLINSSGPEYRKECHSMMHALGRSAYSHFADFERVFKPSQIETCSDGYVHGVLEAYFEQIEDPLGAAATVCDRYKDSSGLYENCVHGIGHGFMYYTGHDLPASLALCSQIKTHDHNCAKGVYMEYASRNFGNGHHHTRQGFYDDSFTSCDGAGKYAIDCYFYVADSFLSVHPHDYTGAIAWCGGADPLYSGSCILRVGHRTLKDNYPDEEIGIRVCGNLKGSHAASCFRGIIIGYQTLFDTDEHLKDFCQNKLDKQYVQYCPFFAK